MKSLRREEFVGARPEFFVNTLRPASPLSLDHVILQNFAMSKQFSESCYLLVGGVLHQDDAKQPLM